MARIADVNIDETERYVKDVLEAQSKKLGSAAAQSSDLRAAAVDLSRRARDVDRD